MQQRGGPQLQERLKTLGGKCLSAVYPLTPQLLTRWLGPDASACRFSPAFYLRLLGEMSADLPAWPDGQKGTGPLEPRAAETVRQLKNLLSQSFTAFSLAEAFEQLSAKGLPKDLSVDEMLAALERNTSLLVDF